MKHVLLYVAKSLTGTFLSLIAILLLTSQVAGGGVDGMIIRPLRMLTGDGSAANPAWSFWNDTNTGVYRSGADTLNVSAGGTSRVSVSTSQFASTVQILGIDGTGATPTYCFGDTATCMYRGGSSSEDISFLMSGGTRWSFTASALLPGANNSYSLGSSLLRYSALRLAHTDMSGTPGDVTINTACGRVAVAVGTNVVVVTNSLTTATSVIVGNISENDATCQSLRYIDPNAGNFEILVNGNCTSATNVDFCVFN